MVPRGWAKLNWPSDLLSSSWLKLMRTYFQPLYPRMHYIQPITFALSETLRRHASEIVVMSLSRTETQLKKEVVNYILDLESHTWSVRRARINFDRISGITICSYEFIDGVMKWKSTPKTLFAFFCIMVCIFFPDMVLSFLPLFVFFTGLFFYLRSSDMPPHINIPFSQANSIEEKFLLEEFDAYPSSREPDAVSERYDYLRRLGGLVQTFRGHVSDFMERLPFLFTWRDGRATTLFLVSCLFAGVLLVLLWLLSLYVNVPIFKLLQVVAVSYLMRPMRFRGLERPWFINFFFRLPPRHDDLL